MLLFDVQLSTPSYIALTFCTVQYIDTSHSHISVNCTKSVRTWTGACPVNDGGILPDKPIYCQLPARIFGQLFNQHFLSMAMVEQPSKIFESLTSYFLPYYPVSVLQFSYFATPTIARKPKNVLTWPQIVSSQTWQISSEPMTWGFRPKKRLDRPLDEPATCLLPPPQYSYVYFRPGSLLPCLHQTVLLGTVCDLFYCPSLLCEIHIAVLQCLTTVARWLIFKPPYNISIYSS